MEHTYLDPARISATDSTCFAGFRFRGCLILVARRVLLLYTDCGLHAKNRRFANLHFGSGNWTPRQFRPNSRPSEASRCKGLNRTNKSRKSSVCFLSGAYSFVRAPRFYGARIKNRDFTISAVAVAATGRDSGTIGRESFTFRAS